MATTWYNAKNPEHKIAIVTGDKHLIAQAIYWLYDSRTFEHYADMGVRVTCDNYARKGGRPMLINELRNNWGPNFPEHWPPHAFIGETHWAEVEP